jgi:hypothetical protein
VLGVNTVELDVEQVEDLGHQFGGGVLQARFGLLGEGTKLCLRNAVSCFQLVNLGER